MNWLKGSTSSESAAKPFGQGRFDDSGEGEFDSPKRTSLDTPPPDSRRRASNASTGSTGRTVVAARRVSVAERTATSPAPRTTGHWQAFSPPAATAPEAPQDDIRDWVAKSIEKMSDNVQEQLDNFTKQVMEIEKKQESQLQKVWGTLKHNADIAKRAEKSVHAALEKMMEIEETVKANVFDHSAFSQLQAQVKEAVEYLDEESQQKIGRLSSQHRRLEQVVKKNVTRTCQDYKDLDLRLTLQSLAASTFALKATTMQEEARAKSLRYLEGEEARVKGAMKHQEGKSPRARLAEEEIVVELSQETPAKPHGKRPSLLGGPGSLAIAESERSQTRGLLELLTAEIFCINAVARDDYTRQMCVDVLKKKAAELRSPTTMADQLETIHMDALSAASSDVIPDEMHEPLKVAAVADRPSVVPPSSGVMHFFGF